MNRQQIHLRLTLVAPPAGVLFSLLDQANRPVDPKLAADADISFDFEIEAIGPLADRRFVGKFVRNQSARRFVYFASGALAGQAGSCWSRRGKVMLDALPASIADARLEARVPGRAGDGGPSCATVKLMEPWRQAAV